MSKCSVSCLCCDQGNLLSDLVVDIVKLGVLQYPAGFYPSWYIITDIMIILNWSVSWFTILQPSSSQEKCISKDGL